MKSDLTTRDKLDCLSNLISEARSLLWANDAVQRLIHGDYANDEDYELYTRDVQRVRAMAGRSLDLSNFHAMMRASDWRSIAKEFDETWTLAVEDIVSRAKTIEDELGWTT